MFMFQALGDFCVAPDSYVERKASAELDRGNVSSGEGIGVYWGGGGGGGGFHFIMETEKKAYGYK